MKQFLLCFEPTSLSDLKKDLEKLLPHCQPVYGVEIAQPHLHAFENGELIPHPASWWEVKLWLDDEMTDYRLNLAYASFVEKPQFVTEGEYDA